MKFRVVSVFAKALTDIGFIEVIINSNSNVYKHLRKDNDGKKYGDNFFHDRTNVAFERKLYNGPRGHLKNTRYDYCLMNEDVSVLPATTNDR